jgi:hypothetical protein
MQEKASEIISVLLLIAGSILSLIGITDKIILAAKKLKKTIQKYKREK